MENAFLNTQYDQSQEETASVHQLLIKYGIWWYQVWSTSVSYLSMLKIWKKRVPASVAEFWLKEHGMKHTCIYTHAHQNIKPYTVTARFESSFQKQSPFQKGLSEAQYLWPFLHLQQTFYFKKKTTRSKNASLFALTGSRSSRFEKCDPSTLSFFVALFTPRV